MFYESLFNPSIHRPVKACLTGAGEFGASFLFQAQGMPLLEVPAVCTRTVQRAVDAYENAGIPASKVRVCESAEDAKKAYADGFNVVVDRFDYIADLPLDVLVESSGAPEASAAAAELAIERGMHVVCNVGGNCGLAYFFHCFLKKLPVLRFVDSLGISAYKADVVFLQKALFIKLHCNSKPCLPA